MPVTADNVLEDVHEERIQRLEDSQKDAAIQLADNVSKIDHLGQMLRTEMERLGERFEHALGPLIEKVARIDPLQVSVVKLEADNEQRKEQYKTYKKAVLAVSIGVFSILGKEVVVALWHLITVNAQ